MVTIGVTLLLPRHTSAQVSPTPGMDPAMQLEEIRLRSFTGRRNYGWALLAWGLASTVAGTTMAIVGRDDETWLWAGITTAAFGAIDAGLAIPLLDVSGRARGDIAAGRSGELDDYDAVREDVIRRELRSGQIFALNTGLDIFYLSSGAILWGFGAAGIGDATNEDRLVGAGVAMVVQSAFLLIADIIHWRWANQHADELAALPAAF